MACQDSFTGGACLTASRIESPLVKSLYPIHEITARLPRDAANRVRLKRGLAVVGASRGLAIAPDVLSQTDPAEAIIAALTDPIEYPPLAAGIVPGDRVTIALDETTPRAAAIVCGAIKSLEHAGVQSDAITVVTSDQSAI